MPTGVQLRELIRGVRAETGQSLSEHNNTSQRETLVYLLQSKQRTLWYAHDWPMHKHYWDVQFQAGDRYIDYPEALDPQRVNRIEQRYNEYFIEVPFGIEAAHRNSYDSETNERGYPLRAWDRWYAPGSQQNQFGQVELWPISSIDSWVRFHGHQRLAPLVSDDDLSMLDSDMLVKYVAGDILARSNKADAELKLREADNMRRNTLGEAGSGQRQPIIYGGGRMRQRMYGVGDTHLRVPRRPGT